MKKIQKFSEFDFVPDGAIYLSTVTEDTLLQECVGHCAHSGEYAPEMRTYVEERKVWHYFTVEVKE